MLERHLHRLTGDWQSPLPVPRARVYRNNVIGALAAALRVRYPVTAELVGEAFFAGMAAAFAENCRPSTPVLIEYGTGFPDFIGGFEPCRNLPYLAQTAQLESLWWQSYHAAEADSLPASVLSCLSAEAFGGSRVEFHPSVRIMQATFAVASIWQAHNGGQPLGTFDINVGQQILIARPGSEISIFTVSVGQMAFLSSLMSGHTVSQAIEGALDRDPGFDIKAQLTGLFGLGLISGLHS